MALYLWSIFTFTSWTKHSNAWWHIYISNTNTLKISANYRPISNLSNISKLLERLILSRIIFWPLGSLWHHQPPNTDRKTSLDFGIDGLVLSWLHSYLSNRSQYVKLGNHTSSSIALLAGVPRALSEDPYLSPPLLYIIMNFSPINAWHEPILSSHSVSDQLDNLWKFTDTINDWHLINFLQFNLQKYEIMFIGSVPPKHLKDLSPHLQ